jgi:hypothetical protein
MAKKGLGAVLAFLKGKIPAESFNKVSNAIPDADGLMAAADADQGESSGGGLLGAAAGMAGRLFGGGSGGGAALASKLTKLGFSPDQLQGFLKNALDSLRGKLPADVVDKLSSFLPT